MTNPPCPAARGIQRVKKALQRLPPLGGEKMKSFFCRGVYLAENTSRAASLAPQRCAERNRRRRLLARSCGICSSQADKLCTQQTANICRKRGCLKMICKNHERQPSFFRGGCGKTGKKFRKQRTNSEGQALPLKKVCCFCFWRCYATVGTTRCFPNRPV